MEAFEKLDKTSGTANVIKNLEGVFSAFSSGGFKSGVKTLGSTIASIIKAHPVITSMAALAAIGWGLDKFVFTADEKYEDASKAVDNYQTTKSEIESINSELETTQQRIDELNAKQTLTLVEQDELNTLMQTNDELERQLKIKEVLEKSELSTAINAVDEYLNDKSTHSKDFALFSPSTWGYATYNWSLYDPENIDGVTNKVAITPIQGIESHIRGLQALQEEVSSLEEDIENAESEIERSDLQAVLKSRKSAIDEHLEWLESSFQDISDITNSFDKSYFSDLGDYNTIMGLLDQYNKLLGVSGAKTQAKLAGIFEIEELKDADTKQALIDYVKALNDVSEFDLNSDSAKNIEGIDRLKEALDGAGVEADDLYQYLKAIADDGLYDLEEVSSQLSESLQDVGKDAEDVIKEFVEDLTDEQLTAVAQIKADAEIDTSQWDIETWRAQIQAKLEEGLEDIGITATTKLNEYFAAEETPNEGVNYDKVVEAAETVKELYESGLVGTDDFLSFAKLISPNDVATVEEYEKAIGKVNRYFTDDYTGVTNFMKDLDAQGLADYNSATGELATNFDNVADAAKQMDMSLELFVMMFQKLSEYGYDTAIYDTVDDAKNALDDYIDEYSELIAKRNALIDSGVEADDSQIVALNDKINQLKDDIDTTTDAYFNLLTGGNAGTLQDAVDSAQEEYNTKKDVLNNLLQQYNDFDWSSVSNEIREKVKTQTEQAMEQLAAELDGTLNFDAEGKVTINYTAVTTVNGNYDKENPFSLSIEEQTNTTVSVDSSQLDETNAKANNLETVLNAIDSTTVTPTIDSTSIDQATTSAKNLSIVLNAIPLSKDITFNIKTNGSIPDTSTTSGSTQVNGNARVNGNWGEKTGGKALVGELGQELIVFLMRAYIVICMKNIYLNAGKS